MQRHLSTGVSTIVALMAAHRIISGGERAQATDCPDEVDRIVAYRHPDDPAWMLPEDDAASRTVRPDTNVVSFPVG